MVFGANKGLGGFGYTAGTSSSLKDVFASAHDNTQLPASNQTLMATVTGIDFTAGLPKTADLSVNTTTSFSGLESQVNDAQGAQAQIEEAGAQFESAVKSVQNVVYEALEQSVAQMNAENPLGKPISAGAAAASIAPQPMSTGFDVVASIGTDSVLGGAASRIAQAVSELGPEFTSLSPEQQSKLLSHMHSLLNDTNNPNNPNRSIDGDLTYDFEGLKPEDLKALLLPPELHPEGQAIASAHHAVEHDVIEHLEGHDIIGSIADGDTAKNVSALASSGANVEQILGAELLEDVKPAILPEAELEIATAEVLPLIEEARPVILEIDPVEVELLASALRDAVVTTDETVPTSAEKALVQASLEPVGVPAAHGVDRDWVRKIDVANVY